MTTNEILDLLETDVSDFEDSDDDFIIVAFFPLQEQAFAVSDEDSDLPYAEAEGDVTHLHGRLLLSSGELTSTGSKDPESAESFAKICSSHVTRGRVR